MRAAWIPYVSSLAGDAEDVMLRFINVGVRGTVRDPQSEELLWMPEWFDRNYGKGKFEMVRVKDMEAKGMF